MVFEITIPRALAWGIRPFDKDTVLSAGRGHRFLFAPLFFIFPALAKLESVLMFVLSPNGVDNMKRVEYNATCLLWRTMTH